MNAIQKATIAASALAITLLGAALVTAPLAFARPQTVLAHQACTATGQIECGVHGETTALVALNRR